MSDAFAFDQNYYDRFYRDPQTRVASQEATDRLADFVCAYLTHIDLHVDRVLDLGCGLGFWQNAIGRHFPVAEYTGVEISRYLCEEMGWLHGSVVDFRSRKKFDLVVCQGVLQYLTDSECRDALENLGRLCRGALYLEALTTQDWEVNCDQSVTDGAVHLRTGAWYRKRLAPHFRNAGGGVFLSHRADASLFELESLE